LISVLSFLGTQRNGILALSFLLIILGGVLNWILWMFGLGRFRGRPPEDSKIRFVLADFFVKIINDFRHLLALVLVILFGLALFAAMWPGMMKQDVNLIKDGLQAVAAALSGLIGSIIGYYFGESAAKSRTPGGDATPPPAVEQDSAQAEAGITVPPKPPPDGKQGEKIE
jgi:hypothetical protein